MLPIEHYKESERILAAIKADILKTAEISLAPAMIKEYTDQWGFLIELAKVHATLGTPPVWVMNELEKENNDKG